MVSRFSPHDLEIRLTVNRPAIVYVLYSDKTPRPPWLGHSFVDTDADIGLDAYPSKIRSNDRDLSGPGKSIDAVVSVWKLHKEEPGEVLLGPVGGERRGEQTMYGIIVVPAD